LAAKRSGYDKTSKYSDAQKAFIVEREEGGKPVTEICGKDDGALTWRGSCPASMRFRAIVPCPDRRRRHDSRGILPGRLILSRKPSPMSPPPAPQRPGHDRKFAAPYDKLLKIPP